MDKKIMSPVESITRGLPVEFSVYLNYCHSIRYEDKPDYGFLRKIFREVLYRSNFAMDFIYDWCTVTDENIKVVA